METVFFDFTPESNLSQWYVVNDGVMGGRSEGQLFLSPNGHGVFTGDVSLENNGGFTSVRYRFPTRNIQKYQNIVLKVKGDGKKYQLRLKSEYSDWHSYKAEFETSGDWQTIEVTLNELIPTFRGRRLRMDNYPGQTISEFTILIGNKIAENFRLEIDQIMLR